MQSLVLSPGVDDTMVGSVCSCSLLVHTSQYGWLTHHEEVKYHDIT
jgi:hypothetical protein